MTFHNLATDTTASLVIEGPASSCTAAIGGICGLGADLVWYTIDVQWPNSGNPIDGEQKHGIYGHCDVYLQGSSGDYTVTHHCSMAENAGLEPPAGNQTK